MLTKHEIALIKESWVSIRKIDPLIFGDAFYTRLFYDNPDLRKLFPASMEDQQRKLFDMLNIIITRLEILDKLKGEIALMAKRHTDYGVKPEHYPKVGKALLRTLQKTLGNEWTEEVRSAWISCYAILSGTMIASSS